MRKRNRVCGGGGLNYIFIRVSERSSQDGPMGGGYDTIAYGPCLRNRARFEVHTIAYVFFFFYLGFSCDVAVFTRQTSSSLVLHRLIPVLKIPVKFGYQMCNEKS